jgi:hypothetical protein
MGARATTLPHHALETFILLQSATLDSLLDKKPHSSNIFREACITVLPRQVGLAEANVIMNIPRIPTSPGRRAPIGEAFLFRQSSEQKPSIWRAVAQLLSKHLLHSVWGFDTVPSLNYTGHAR